MRAALARWLDHPDPRQAQINRLAFMLALNQPLFAPSLVLLYGSIGWVAWPQALHLPLYLLVPWLARRNADAARRWLVVLSIGTTAQAMLLLGAASGVWLFLFPCVALAGWILPARHIIAVAAACLAVLWLGFDLSSSLPADAAAHLFKLNALAALGLTGFIGWLLCPSATRQNAPPA